MDHTPSRACYRRGCKRPECYEANKTWWREYKRRRANGKPATWQPEPYSELARIYDHLVEYSMSSIRDE